MSTTQRVLGFVAGLAAVFALGLGLGQLVDLEEPVPAHETPSHAPTSEASPEPSPGESHAPSHAPDDHQTETPDDDQ